jgi:outer membrane protein assembly factor BamA
MFALQSDYLGGRQKMSIPEIMYRYRYNNTNDRNYPTDGWEIDSYLDHKGLGLVKDFDHWQLYLHLANYRTITPRLSASAHFRGRLFGPDKQPYFNYRAMGYENDYVRGFEYYIVDGSHYALLRTDLRYKLFAYNFKQNILPILKHVPIDFYPKIYGDAGYVWSNNFGNSFLNNKKLFGYGLGMDIVFSYYVKLRLEYSFNSLKEKGLFLHLRNE